MAGTGMLWNGTEGTHSSLWAQLPARGKSRALKSGLESPSPPDTCKESRNPAGGSSWDPSTLPPATAAPRCSSWLVPDTSYCSRKPLLPGSRQGRCSFTPKPQAMAKWYHEHDGGMKSKKTESQSHCGPDYAVLEQSHKWETPTPVLRNVRLASASQPPKNNCVSFVMGERICFQCGFESVS